MTTRKRKPEVRSENGSSGNGSLHTVDEGNGGTLHIPEGIVAEDRLWLPTLDGVDPEAIIARDMKIQEMAPRIAGWVPTVLCKVEGLEALTQDQRALLSPEERQRVQDAMGEVRRFLHEEKKAPWRRAAQMAYVLYFLAKTFRSIDEIVSVLTMLVQEKILAESADGTGPIKLGTRNMHWAAPEASPLDSDAVATIQAAVEKALSDVMERQRQAEQAEAKQLLAMGNLTARKFLNGQLGRLVLPVPTYTDNEGRVFRGGVVALDLTEERAGAGVTKVIRPVVMTGKPRPFIALAGKLTQAVAAVGEIKATYAETAALGAFLQYDSLGWEEPPFLAIPKDISWLLHSQTPGVAQPSGDYRMLLKLLLAKATITFLEFMEGRDGDVVLFVPTVEDGNKKKHLGGAMLVRKIGNEVSVLKAIGAIEADCAAISNARVFLKYISLLQKKVPFSEPKGRMQQQVNLFWAFVKSSLFHARRMKITMMWYTITRGLEAAVRQEEEAEAEQAGGGETAETAVAPEGEEGQ